MPWYLGLNICLLNSRPYTYLKNIVEGLLVHERNMQQYLSLNGGGYHPPPSIESLEFVMELNGILKVIIYNYF